MYLFVCLLVKLIFFYLRGGRRKREREGEGGGRRERERERLQGDPLDHEIGKASREVAVTFMTWSLHLL